MMNHLKLAFARAATDTRGTMVIETAIVLPVLVLMSLGTFEASRMVARQYELQSAAGEAELIAVATGSGASTAAEKIKAILSASVGLDADQISVDRFYRCNDNDSTVSDASVCGEDDVVSSYVRLDIRDTYTPVWTAFGIGSPVEMEVERTVYLS